MDKNPVLKPTPPERVTRILCGIPVRKPPIVLNAFLQTLAWQQFRDKVKVDFLLIDNFSDLDPFAEDSRALLEEFDGEVIQISNDTEDYGEKAGTRAWSKPAFERMAGMKNLIINRAMEGEYDYLLFVDADVMCDPFTFQSLLDTAGHEKYLADPRAILPVVSGVYWTDWSLQPEGSTQVSQIQPQVWLRHPYHQDGLGWSAAAFREALVNRSRVPVGGLGACTLIPAYALHKGLGFHRFGDLPPGPMADGEDRHFCAWANKLHINLVADAWSDIYHAYHPEEYPGIGDQLEKLARARQEKLEFGDLVSAKVELLDPIPDKQGRMHTGLTEWIRGRIGSLKVLPAIEKTLLEMKVGTHKLIRLKYPANYTLPELSLQTKIVRLSLFDAKPFKMAPTVEEEFDV